MVRPSHLAGGAPCTPAEGVALSCCRFIEIQSDYGALRANVWRPSRVRGIGVDGKALLLEGDRRPHSVLWFDAMMRGGARVVRLVWLQCHAHVK